MKKDSETLDFEIAFFGKLVAQQPNYVEALRPLAEAYTRKGLYDKGLELDKRLASLCPDDPIVFYNFGCSLCLTGHKEEALQILRQAVVLGYDDFKFMKKDSDLKDLHNSPEFLKLFPSSKKR